MEWPSTITYRPIERWPGTLTARRKSSPFFAPLKRTLEQLTTEIREIHGTNVVLQIALIETQFRNDGMPRAHAEPEHPGVILSIETADGPLSFPCDTFTSWHENLRAIVLTMERLRAAGRYGVTKHGEQYRGWRAIESAAPTFDRASALEHLRRVAQIYPEDVGKYSVDEIVRKALRWAHPDMGGSEAEVHTVRQAEAVLRGES